MVVLVVATTGEGDATDNARKFNRFLTSKSTPADALRGLKYTVFGLGDLNYINFNQMGKRTELNMDRLGAVKVYPRGIGDASQDIEADLRKWIDGGLVIAVKENLPCSKPLKSGLPDLLEMLNVSRVGDTVQEFEEFRRSSRTGMGTLSKVFWTLEEASIVSNSELRQISSETSSTRELAIRLGEQNSEKYHACDTIEILPKNSAEIIDWALKFFDEKDRIIDFSDGPTPFPTPCSLSRALLQYMDLSCCPSASFLENLSVVNHKNPPIQEALASLANDANLCKEMEKHFVTFPLLMELFEHHFGTRVQLSISQFFQIGPKQKIRAYTGAGFNANSLRIVASLTSTTSPPLDVFIDKLVLACILPPAKPFIRSKTVFKGLCTSFLTRVSPDEKILVRVRKSALRPPCQPPRHFLAICTGAGIAPFMAYIDWFQQIDHWPESTVLVFGCRNPDTDFIYNETLSRLNSKGKIRALFAFSRKSSKRIYVQDIIKEDRGVHKILHADSSRKIIVCGSTPMARSVSQLLATHLGGQSALEQLEKDGTLSVEYFG